MAENMLDDALAVLDHIASRVTASAVTGLGCGAAYSSLKGFPIFKTSVSTAFSFALVSTACFAMERAADTILRQSSILIGDGKSIDSDSNGGGEISPATQPAVNLGLHYGSHALGGLTGGGVVGFLFQGKPLAGALLMTPMMLAIGKIEASVDEYRTVRLRQIMADHLREEEKRSP